MKDDIAFSKSKRLGHTRAHFNLMTALAEWAISDAGGKDKVFGTKPGVAGYTPVDLGAEQKRATQSNLSNMGDIEAFLERILPGYKEMLTTGSKSTLSLLRGEIPQDVQDAVKRSSAFQALSGGFGGSPMAKALTARDFGRTSLDLMSKGENSAQRWASISQQSVAPFTITTPMQADVTGRNNLYDQATKQHALNVAAAPDPGAAGQFNLMTALGSTAMSFGLGSAMGGGGSGGSLQPKPQQSDASAYNAGLWNAGNSWGNWYG